MFILRKHDFDDDNRYLLTKWLNLGRPNLQIVEMGSGSGYFTQQLVRMAKDPQIICIEPDEVLMDYARKSLGEKVAFKKGFVENPPLSDCMADLVICHVLLCNVPDINVAVRGMIKVAKPGGAVCSYGFTALINRHNSAIDIHV
jgi:ubiquinone/menaquinone biosynthesis C-methylase UbiE